METSRQSRIPDRSTRLAAPVVAKLFWGPPTIPWRGRTVLFLSTPQAPRWTSSLP